ncbi:MAG: antibiotic biosynthesis monooxygenase [Candidatus Nitrosopolaris sp.]
MVENQIHMRADFKIEEGKIEEFKKLIQNISKLVETNEPDTTNYQFYLNKAETKCIVTETYASSEAALAHTKGVALQTILPKILSVAKMTRIDVYGNPSEELEKVITGHDAQTYNFYVGFIR